MSLSYLLGPIAAVLCNRFSCRVTVISGALVTAVGLLLTSQAPSILIMYVTYGVVCSFGACCVYTGCFVIAPRYVVKPAKFVPMSPFYLQEKVPNRCVRVSISSLHDILYTSQLRVNKKANFFFIYENNIILFKILRLWQRYIDRRLVKSQRVRE